MPSIGSTCHELRIHNPGGLLEKGEADPYPVDRRLQREAPGVSGALRRSTMDEQKRTRLKEAGWSVGDISDFLKLTPEEREYVELKLALARGLRVQREERGLTQAEVADRVGSSQSRVAKMELGDGSVSVDLLVRTLLKLGANRSDLADLLRQRRPKTRAV
jgi:predicted XRE-type DNA-binding protein